MALGAWNRVDPFEGNRKTPQSLHKYGYCQGDPVNAKDPSGTLRLLNVLSAITIRLSIAVRSVPAAIAAQKTASLLLGGALMVNAYVWSTSKTRILFVEGGNGKTTSLVNPDATEIVSVLNSLANRDAEITHIFIQSHSSEDSMILSDDPILTLNTSPDSTEVRLLQENGSAIGLSNRLNEILVKDGTIFLEGCKTGHGSQNLARNVSAALPKAFVVGGKRYQAGVPLNARSFGKKKIYQDGDLVNTGWAIGSVPNLAE
jgi:hypothetical protein